MTDKSSPPRPEPSVPGPGGLSVPLERNIDALMDHRRRKAAEATLGERIAERVSRFAGSMTFVVIHALVYGFWIVANLSLIPGVPAWDPSMVVLAMIASVEAIFLSTFILISQNRLADAENMRAELNLQVNLLAEHEITKLFALVSEIAIKLQVPFNEHEVAQMRKDVAPEAVLKRIEDVQE